MLFFACPLRHGRSLGQPSHDFRSIILAFFLLIALQIALVACGGAGSTPGQLPTGHPMTSPSPSSPPSRLYLSGSGAIDIFALPLTNGSTVADHIADTSFPQGMSFDPTHRLFVANRQLRNNGSVQIFTQPLANGAIPAFSLTTGTTVCVPTGCGNSAALDVAFDRAGDLFVVGSQPFIICPTIRCPELVTGGMFMEFIAPITSSSTPSVSSSGSGVPLLGDAIDHNGDLWIARSDGELVETNPPFGAGSGGFELAANTSGGVAFDAAGNLYVATAGGVDVYRPPFSSSMTRAFTISATLPQFLAFDQAGNLYVTAGSQMLVFTPPFSGATGPLITLTPPNAEFGIAIGP